jgi:hypothetical protein
LATRGEIKLMIDMKGSRSVKEILDEIKENPKI